MYRREKIFSLFTICLPLAYSDFLSSYIINASKLSIDKYMNDSYQIAYSAIYMPNMVINLMSGMIFKPLQTTMASYYNNKQYKEFFGVIRRIVLFIMLLLGICEIGAFLLGIPVLSWLYGLELEPYRGALLILLLAGGLNATNIIFYYVLTIMRKQRYMMLFYSLTTVVAFVSANYLTVKFGIQGAAIAYLLTMLSLNVILIVGIGWLFGKEKKNG